MNFAKFLRTPFLQNTFGRLLLQPELSKLVITHQLYRHSKTYRKYKNQSYRSQFGRFFSKQTIVTEPLPSNTPENNKLIILESLQQVLSKVKDYINSYPNPK